MESLNIDSSKIFVPDNLKVEEALKRTTDLVFAAHQDDIEIMAAAPIIECFHNASRWLGAIVLTDGRGSPRSGKYNKYSDEQMINIRSLEQKKAAILGEYSFLVELQYTSSEIKSSKNKQVISDIKNIITCVQPERIYTHNLADKHDTHVAVCLRVIEALRELKSVNFKYQVFGCEVWRGLDWMCDKDKLILDVSNYEHLQQALIAVFDSQISGGKRYDLATIARRIANATYLETHEVDQYKLVNYAMDLTPLCIDLSLKIEDYIKNYIDNFWNEIKTRINKLQ